MMLSRHISQASFEHSNDAVALKIKNEMNARQCVIAKEFCGTVLDPVIDYFGEMPSSLWCFRGDALAKAKNYSWGSHHRMKGGYAAADIEFKGISNWALSMVLSVLVPFDQIILELHYSNEGPNSGWVHIGWKQNPKKNRYQLKTYNGKTYTPGLH